MDRRVIYDLVYALAASGGRDAALFGDGADMARAAFARALAGEAFPEVWFELPLAGEPWFDVHVLTAHADVAGTQARFAGHGGRYDEALAWFVGREEGVRQLALSYDVSAGNIDEPAVQLLAGRRGTDVARGFLEAAGRPEAGEAFRAFCSALPDGWYACYTGVFPGRATLPGAPFLRVECIVGDRWQREYARDPATLVTQLRGMGMTGARDALATRCQVLASSPFPLEFQFDVLPDGSAGATLGASVRFAPADWRDDDGRDEMGRLMRQTCAWGLADERWQLLADMAFARRITNGDEETVVFCYPAFLKLRWNDGTPLDAKTYVVAGA